MRQVHVDDFVRLDGYGAVQWAGTDVVLRSVGRLEVPGRNWTTTGDFLLRGTLEGMWGVDGAVYQMHNDNTLHRYDLDGGEIGWEPFTTDMSLHDVTTGKETLIASVDEDVGHRAEWPTYRPRAIVDDELIIGFIHS